MRKIVAVIIVVLIILVTGIFLIHGKRAETDVTKKHTKVGFVMLGNRDDKSYNQSHFQSMEKTKETLNLEVLYRESVPTDETCVTVMEELIKEGCEIVICNSYDYGKWIYQVAEKYPDIYFFHASGITQSKNLATYFGRMYQMRYLSGIVAGLQTQTNEIGYVASFDLSEVNRGINAFTLGVRSVNKDAVVHVEWSGTWTEDEAVEVATNKLLDNYNIDVIAMHSDSIRALEIAEERGIWSIGYNVDNSDNFPKTFLTAPIWQWENYYEPYIRKCLQGKFKGENYWEGTSTGVVGLAKITDNAKPEAKEKVEQMKQKMENEFFDVFNGPIMDSEGTLRIGEGENMSDEAMLNEFDWYVEGVIVHE